MAQPIQITVTLDAVIVSDKLPGVAGDDLLDRAAELVRSAVKGLSVPGVDVLDVSVDFWGVVR